MSYRVRLLWSLTGDIFIASMALSIGGVAISARCGKRGKMGYASVMVIGPSSLRQGTVNGVVKSFFIPVA